MPLPKALQELEIRERDRLVADKDRLKNIRDLIRIDIPESGLCKGKMVLWGGGIGHEIALCVSGNSYEEAVLNSLWGLLKE
jgi:hypothetical protein